MSRPKTPSPHTLTSDEIHKLAKLSIEELHALPPWQLQALYEFAVDGFFVDDPLPPEEWQRVVDAYGTRPGWVSATTPKKSKGHKADKLDRFMEYLR